MDVATLHRRAVEAWVERLDAIGDEQWASRTPCEDWNVRELVNHVVGEERWTVPLLKGRTIAEVGNELDGDLLGSDPVASGRKAAEQATAIVNEMVPEGGRVGLSYGEEDINQYVYQLSADHLIHGWDLAAATGGDTRLDPELVDEVAAWFVDKEEMYRAGGVVGPRASSAGGAMADLLAGFGRSSEWAAS